jgi:hypothetical protein
MGQWRRGNARSSSRRPVSTIYTGVTHGRSGKWTLDLPAEVQIALRDGTRLIHRLEAAGFVRRARDPGDRRKVIVEPILEVLRELIG